MEKEPLQKLATLSHEHRMAVFRLLLRRYPDEVPAGEIGTALSLRPSTASVYLSALMDAGLIGQRRQGTSLLYRSNIDAMRDLMAFLFSDCCRGRPDLCPPLTVANSDDRHRGTDRTYNVLFICTGNSARSIFAETLLRDLGGGRFNAYSAGTAPYSELNPYAVSLLAAKGHDTAPLNSKNIREFQGADAPVMDFVFTVCDRAANENCPAWHGQPISAHWGMPDPVKATGSDAEKTLAFQHSYAALKNRIRAFTALPFDTLDKISLQKAVDDIGGTNEREPFQ